MDDTSDSRAQAGRPPPTWLLLTHALPSEPAYVRVKVHRRLKAIGALSLKNGAHVLPDTESAREDFEWVLREVVSSGGEATLSRIELLGGLRPEALVEAFVAERNQEYARIATDAVTALDSGNRRVEAARLRRRLAAVLERDHLGAPGRTAAERSIVRLEGGEEAMGGDSREAERPHGAVWVTRSGVRVDRMASAWLIRRHIDPAARFRFVDADRYTREAGELRFDMYGGEYTHEGDGCTFETLLNRFSLEERALRAIGDIVHDIDLKEERYGRVETAGVASALAGIAAVQELDGDRVEAAMPLFDGLLASFRAAFGEDA